MSSRTGVSQLSNGLYISGRPEQLKERSPVIVTRAVPYTGGDVKKSGELGKMYGVVDVSSSSTQDHHHHPHPHPPGIPPSLKASSKPSSSSQLNSGSVRSGPNSGSGPLGFKSSNSGSIPKKYTSSSSSFSGPMTPITPTGLITSGPLGITPGARSSRSGNLESPSGPSVKAVYGSAVTSLSDGPRYGFKVSRVAMWVALIVAVMGLLVGSFLMVAVKKAVILVAVVAFLILVLVVIAWNFAYREIGLVGFLRRYPNAELRGAADGQHVKVTGVVTCGSVPLESSFQRVPRCVFTSTELYESPGCGGKSANHRHCFSSSGCRYAERYAADFYISDFQSGLRAFVKAGYGAKVAAFVKPTKVVDITKENKDVSPNFLRWLAARSLSSEDRIMHLKESYIKEGSTVSVMGTVQRHENILMIVPPEEPTSTGCQWLRFLLPTYVEGIVLTCDENQNADVIPV